MDADTLFLAAGAVIFMGFISNYLFRRFKAPDVLILMVLGIALGPGGLGLINAEAASGIESLTPYVAAAALAIIMFQAGMDLAIGDVVKSFSKSLYPDGDRLRGLHADNALVLTLPHRLNLETCLSCWGP